MRPRFSDRIGVTQTPEMLQIDEIDAQLRASIWNIIHSLFESQVNEKWVLLARAMAVNVTKTPLDDLPKLPFQKQQWVRGCYDAMEWYEVYNFIEFLVDNANRILRSMGGQSTQLIEAFNGVLERERSGYRFVAGVLSPITTREELEAVEDAVQSTGRAALAGANEHLRTALALLGQKPEPDYRNATKEAISAIESVTKILGESSAQGLSGALADLNKKVEIHPSLRNAFVKLYGYASNEEGVRHSLGDESANVGFDEAKYMIVACSAFMNYLISKANAAGLLTGK
ncbi:MULTISPECIES: AbiJ-NTD4 domain-containing protein [Burkholderia cepacia complex]|uniref:AbiJ-NTD4 domain-containing protein n=1 Tax=Burkholderia cepacia complex TaxID=87882 RepID=UPI000756FBF1|nr:MULTISPECIES: hypothetical protein [Burkholderia cepacia complex]KVE61125.1 hypothetical protein WI94_27350 [Burkholderia vietnamiensis]KVE80541.1 hypothetical protein WJ00_03240 [Burkholderia vietnamiensis]KWF92310.1 hypothetical protein WL95_19085 [Burkholderia cepacia]MDN7928016.1 hypothetical protein [Burkholderia vietnamiensis]HDR9253369.1 hypothetical protein [Burkholderia vietnamiensis]